MTESNRLPYLYSLDGGGHPPGLQKQDLARCYARTFPDHAEREYATGIPVYLSGAKWQSGYSDLNRNYSCSQSRCHDQVRRYSVICFCV